MISLAHWGWGAVVGAMLMACGGEDTSPSDDNDDSSGSGASGGSGASASGGSGASASGGSGSSASGGSDGGGSDGSGGATPGSLSGPTPLNDPDFIASVRGPEAQFSVWHRYKDSAGAKSTCPAIVDGSCALFTCAPGTDFEGVPAADGFGEDYVEAGTVSATFGHQGTNYSTGVMTNDQQAHFQSMFQPSTGMLLGGELITYSLSGDDIPAFSAMIPFPQSLITTNSGAVEGDTFLIEVDRTKDFTVNWSGGAPGVLYQVSGGTTTGPSLLYCEFDSSLAQGTIPAALLGQIAATTRLSTITASAIRTNLGGYMVSLAAGTGTFSASGDPVMLRVF